jgi:MFS family permease
VLLLFLLKEKRLTPATAENSGFFAFFSYWKIAPATYRQLIPGLLLFALFNSSDVFLLLRTREITGSDQTTIMAYVFYNLVYALAAYPAGILADKFGLRTTFISGLLLFAMTYAGFAMVKEPWMVFGLFFLYGLYAAATEGIIKAWITNLAHTSNTATAIGFYTSWQSICSLLASIIAGFLWAQFGPMAAFAAPAVVCVVVVVYLRTRIYSTN